VLAIVTVDRVPGEFMLWNMSGDGSDVHVCCRATTASSWKYAGGNAPGSIESIRVESAFGDRVELRQAWDGSWSGVLIEPSQGPVATPAPFSSTADATTLARSR
jgi:hypothetical protein